jgi:hypothetical protein
MNALPPWEARSERDRQWMIDWCLAELDGLDGYIDGLIYDDDAKKDWTVYPKVPDGQRLESAKLHARRGNLGPLRKLFPAIAEFIREPERVRGQRRSYVVGSVQDVFRRHARREAEQRAVDSVRQLRATIWPRYYGRVKRRLDDGPSAEEIAAVRCDLTVDQVRRAMKTRKASRISPHLISRLHSL